MILTLIEKNLEDIVIHWVLENDDYVFDIKLIRLSSEWNKINSERCGKLLADYLLFDNYTPHNFVDLIQFFNIFSGYYETEVTRKQYNDLMCVDFPDEDKILRLKEKFIKLW